MCDLELAVVLISLKQQQSKHASRNPIDFVTEAAFTGTALMDASPSV